jgi:hypothetical protein
MSGISQATIAAYLETDYRVHGEPHFVLRIGVPSPALARLYRQRGAVCAAFVTACNPHGRKIDEAANAVRQAELERELNLRGLGHLDGEGGHPAGGWPAEASFLVLGIALEEAKELGRRYRQNAVVWCGADAVPELVLLR